MYKILAKVLLSVFLLSEDFLIVNTQNIPSASSTENVVVSINNFIKSEEIASSLNKNKSEKNSAGDGFARTARAKTSTTMKELFACAIALDASCLVDRVEDIVDNANNNLLRQADAEAKKMSFGRTDDENEEESTPSTLISSIARMVLEIPELLRDSINGMLRSGKLEIGEIPDGSDSDEEGTELDSSDNEEEEDENDDDANVDEGAAKDDDDDDDDEEEEDDNAEDNEGSSVQAKSSEIAGRKKCGKKKGGSCQSASSDNSGSGGDFTDKFGGNGTTSGREVGDGRGKKKKQKKKAIIKLLLLGVVLFAKFKILLKVLAAKLQIKFLIIALANLLINLARLWWDFKKGHHEQPQKVIYYEHAQHQHHYDGHDGGEDWHSSSPGGSYWARSYDEGEDGKSAQDMAYAKQIPQGTTYSRVNDKPNISWSAWG